MCSFGKVCCDSTESDSDRLESKPKWCGAANGPSSSSSTSAGSEHVPMGRMREGKRGSSTGDETRGEYLTMSKDMVMRTLLIDGWLGVYGGV